MEAVESCQERVGLGIRKNLITLRVIKPWNQLLSKVVDAPCQSVFKRY